MNLTVSARIAGGFAIVVLLLLTISLVSLMGVNNINKTMESVVDEATPMLRISGEMVSTLLEANDRANRHQKAHVIDQLGAFEVQFNELQDEYDRKRSVMLTLAQNHPEITKAFRSASDNVESYFSSIPGVFSSHRQELTLRSEISSDRSSFEDVADELDSLVYDLSEELSGDDLSSVRSMGNLIREGTISTTDALNLDNTETIATVNRDFQAITDSVMEKFNGLSNKARSSEYYGEMSGALTKFTRLGDSSSGLLAKQIQRLNAAASSSKQLVDAEKLLSNSIEDLRAGMDKVKDFADQSKETAVEQVTGTFSLIITFSVIAIGVGVGISLYVNRSIRKPLEETVAIIAKLADGDLTQKVYPTSHDEFGELFDSVGHLTTKLRDILGGIASGSQQLAASAEQTAAIARQGHESINRQKQQTELVATAMAEMTATVNEVANSANSTLGEVQDANTETTKGQSIVRENVATINRLAGEIERASHVIDKLNEYSDNIGSVLDVIRGIADQTNLLALNAAIEAARAGEQGRGFAVVADEVRTLASKTQVSTSEIQDMIERLQNGTKDAVAVMEKSQTEARVSVDQTAKAGEALESITRAVGVINDMSTHIASSAEEQSAVTNEMHENITNISTLAEQNAQGANESLSASQQLAKLAEQLQQMVSQFKL